MTGDAISGPELRAMLRSAKRPQSFLAGEFDLSRTQVARWALAGVPEKHVSRVRELLPPVPKGQR